ncbi:MAG: glycosyltransferase family 9 protein [bacterium]
MSRILVIRFGALGDLCLLTWSLAKFARHHSGDGGHRVTLVTKAAYADLMRHATGIESVIPLPGPRLSDLLRLARILRPSRFDQVIDAHHNLRSILLLTMLGRRPTQRLAKDTSSRLSLLFLRRRTRKLHRTMRDRFDTLFQPAPSGQSGGTVGTNQIVTPHPLARLTPVTNEPIDLSSGQTAAAPVLGLAPGARWDTKRWPAEYFARFLQEFRKVSSAPVRLFLGPQERAWFADSDLARTASGLNAVEICQEQDLIRTATALAGCSSLLTNDTGLLHLAEAVGVPVLALFGPTVRDFGYFPHLPQSLVLQRELDCRPCSRNGKRPCWRLDQACLQEISPLTVLATLSRMAPWSEFLPKVVHRG